MSLATYEFLPWLREGLGTNITEKDTLSTGGIPGGRPLLKLQLDVNNQSAGTKEFLVVGPADVIGFSNDSVIRTEPLDSHTTFTSNLLAHVEFYEEDFPWRYSPARADGEKLRPWISLIVLKEKEFTRKDVVVPLPQIEITQASLLQDADETWLWAHVQKIVSSTLTTDKNLSDHIISRLICPRKLEANTKYFAFVVPTFESGRLAGLGQKEEDIVKANSQDPAWNKSSSSLLLPVFYEWSFRTAQDMDFEYLAGLLEARVVDPAVGKRTMDCSKPGFGIQDYQTEFTVYIEGALRAPATGVPGISTASATNLADLNSKIKQLLDLGPQSTADPVVVPPFYGQKHLFETSLSLTDNTWIHQLNRDPSYRGVSGLGAKVFRKYQDKYLQKAWEQLETIVEANKLIENAHASITVSKQIFEKHLAGLPAEELLSVAAPVHVKIRIKDHNGKEQTLLQAFNLSCFNGSVYSSAFRRLISKRGRIRKKIDPSRSKFSIAGIKKIQLAKSRRPFVVNNPQEYKCLIIDRPEFKAVYRPSFEDRQLGISPQDLEQIVTSFANIIKNPPAKSPCETNIQHKLIESLDPANTLFGALVKMLSMPEQDWFNDPFKIKPALAYPDFEDPMYEKLKEISIDWIAPNLNLIPDNSITLLESNRKFIEAFMVGVNVAMNQEMRWREYPTDERGSCFRQFWDVKGLKDVNNGIDPSITVDQFKDISPMHTWKNWLHETGKEYLDQFGSHVARTQLKEDEQVVLVIRGDLLKCFPNTTIYAAKAEEATYTENGQQVKKFRIAPGGSAKFPSFKADAGADLKFLGFDLTTTDVKSTSADAGWFFVLQETPGETTFGLDLHGPPTSATWEDASWDIVNGSYISKDDNIAAFTGTTMNATEAARWRRSSADMAWILYQKPVMMAIHANEMLS